MSRKIPPSHQPVRETRRHSNNAIISSNGSELDKVVTLIQHIHKVVMSVQPERELEQLSSLTRQLKLHLTVHTDVQVLLCQSMAIETLISLPRRCMNWAGILTDMLVCISIAVLPSILDNSLIELMCRNGLTEALLDILVAICNYVFIQRKDKSKAPQGKDIVFDGSIIAKTTVHLLIKNGAIHLLPAILMMHYSSFEERGAECIILLLLFILEHSSPANAQEICSSIDKSFVNSVVSFYYKIAQQQKRQEMEQQNHVGYGGIPEAGLNDMPHVNVVIIIAALIYCNEEIASALARDRKKWSVIGDQIASSYNAFEDTPRRISWYRGCFEAISSASLYLPTEEDHSTPSVMSIDTKNTRGSKLSRSNSTGQRSQQSLPSQHSASLSPIGSNNKSPVISRTKSSIVSYEEKGGEEGSGNKSFSSDIEVVKPGSSVQYALDKIAQANDPLYIETDVSLTTTSVVLHRLMTGPYSGGTLQNRHDLPGSYKSPKRSSPQAKHQGSALPDGAMSPLIITQPTDTTSTDTGAFSPGAKDVDNMSDDFIYEDTGADPSSPPIEENAVAIVDHVTETSVDEIDDSATTDVQADDSNCDILNEAADTTIEPSVENIVKPEVVDNSHQSDNIPPTTAIIIHLEEVPFDPAVFEEEDTSVNAPTPPKEDTPIVNEPEPVVDACESILIPVHVNETPSYESPGASSQLSVPKVSDDESGPASERSQHESPIAAAEGGGCCVIM